MSERIPRCLGKSTAAAHPRAIPSLAEVKREHRCCHKRAQQHPPSHEYIESVGIHEQHINRSRKQILRFKGPEIRQVQRLMSHALEACWQQIREQKLHNHQHTRAIHMVPLVSVLHQHTYAHNQHCCRVERPVEEPLIGDCTTNTQSEWIE